MGWRYLLWRLFFLVGDKSSGLSIPPLRFCFPFLRSLRAGSSPPDRDLWKCKIFKLIFHYLKLYNRLNIFLEPIKARYTSSYLDLFCFLCFLAKSLRLSNSPAFMSCVFIWFSRLRWSLSSPRRLSWFRSWSKLILSLVFSSFTPAPTIFPIVPLPWLADIDWKRFW